MFPDLQTITTSNVLWIQKTWFLGKSARLKSCQGTTFELIIIKIRLKELLNILL